MWLSGTVQLITATAYSPTPLIVRDSKNNRFYPSERLPLILTSLSQNGPRVRLGEHPRFPYP